MRILSHYFIARYLGLFVMVLGAALIILTGIELVLQFDASAASSLSASPSSPASSASSGGSGASVSGYGDFAGPWASIRDRLLAYYFPDLLPLASLIAAFLTFAVAGRKLEILAIQAGGIRVARVVLPVLFAATMLSLANAILHETVVLGAERNQQGKGRQAEAPIDFGQKEFWFQRGRTITNVSQADSVARTLDGVEIFERGMEGSVERVIRARHVRIAHDGRWELQDARIWLFDSHRPNAAPSLEEHAVLMLDLDSLGGDTLLGAEPGLLPMSSLIQVLNSPQERLPSRQRQLEERLHQRLSRPWLVLLFAWVALPFGLQVNESGRTVGPALKAILALGFFFVSRAAGATLVHQGMLSASWTIWSPIAFFAVAASVLLWRRL